MNNKFIEKDIAHFIINPELTEGKDIDIFATEKLVKELSEKTIQQAINTATTEGVYKINLNSDAHEGYGCPIGSMVAAKDIIMPGPVGYDISCSVSYLQTNLDPKFLEEKSAKRALINKICEYVPYGTGTTRAKKQIKIKKADYLSILNNGASNIDLMNKLGIDTGWLEHLERQNLPADVELLSNTVIKRGEDQLGSIGSGNHFLEAQKVKILDSDLALKWGITEGIAFLTHCGSRGLGHQIATEYFKELWNYFSVNNISLKDRELVYAKIDSDIGRRYWLSMGCAANFAIVNHLILNTAVKLSLEELYPSIEVNFIYLISHNLAQKEKINNDEFYIHRKGATRAFPAGHPALKNTRYYETGHPIIIPGSSIAGSSIMVALESAKKNFYTVPHGAGRAMGRMEAKRKLSQKYVDEKMAEANVLFNKRNYPIDEFAEAYKDYKEVINSVVQAKLAKETARLKPLFVIKGD
ncbi:MAG: RtcB family protein [bacterium]